MIGAEAIARVLRPPRKVRPSAWAHNLVIPDNGNNPEPGPTNISRTAYVREILDTITTHGVEEVVLVAAVQSSKSHMTRIILGYWIDVDPGSVLAVYPTEPAAKENLTDQILSHIKSSPKLRRHLTSSARDQARGRIKLDSMTIFAGWSGSPQSLASRACRRVLLDEIDKYEPFSGRDASPVALAERRTTTYRHRRTILKVSTPTVRTGAIWQAREACADKREFWVPCPECGKYQILAFTNLRWEKRDDDERPEVLADRIEADRSAWYECAHCGAVLHEREKGRMVARGLWATEGYQTVVDGAVVGDRPPSKKVAFRYSALVSPWVPWSETAAQFLRSKSDVGRLMDFRNNYLAEPFEDSQARPKPSVFDAKRKKAPPAGVVPPWAGALIAGADTQKDHFWFVVRAFGHVRGPEGTVLKRSQLIAYGRADTFADLRRRCLDTAFPVEGSNRTMMPEALAIDSGGGVRTDMGGNRTHEVYEFALTDMARIWAVKGHGGKKRQSVPIRVSNIPYEPAPGHTVKVELHLIDTIWFKDLLAADIPKPLDASGAFFVNADIGADYVQQMTSEQRIFVGGRDSEERWVPITSGAANHLWDCYDAETEVLTHGGWVPFPDLREGVKLATVDLSADRVEYALPSSLIARDHDGPMVKIGGECRSRVDLLVTPNHRVVAYESQVQRGPLIKHAKDLTIWDKMVGFVSDWPEDEQAPDLGVDVDPVDLAELLGWYVAEGYASFYVHKSQPKSPNRRVVIYQNPGAGQDALKALLERLPWRFHSFCGRGFGITNKALYEHVAPLGDVYSKRAPKWIMHAGREVTEAFLRGAVAGDGWTEPTGHETYASVSQGLTDDIGTLFMRLGYPVSFRRREARPYRIDDRSGANTKPQFWVRRKSKRRISLRNANNEPNFSTVNYQGRVYCATVPNGTLIVRRHGKVVVCGNCETYCRAVAWQKGAFDWMTQKEVEDHEIEQRDRPKRSRPGLRTPDGRPFLVTRR